ncbi:MAG: ABC transporter ATP-binding protein [Candidatus Bathyarchaeota archaeon]|nr:MAG: ABC transporter ATP-binding protein [Candidatus Bathyarchaeota archaeon]
MLIVETRDLTRCYQLGSSRITAVNEANLQIAEGSIVSIVGPSGSGKTTLLNLIGLNDEPTSGEVYFKERKTSTISDKERREIRLRDIGFIFQTFNLLPTLTALENVELPMALLGTPQRTQRIQAIECLGSVGLAERLEHKPRELSNGEMQRVAIARALANNPTLILADEPTGELDSETGREIIELLLRLSTEKATTVIVATHDERVAEVSKAKLAIRDGEIKT